MKYHVYIDPNDGLCLKFPEYKGEEYRPSPLCGPYKYAGTQEITPPKKKVDKFLNIFRSDSAAEGYVCGALHSSESEARRAGYGHVGFIQTIRIEVEE